MPTTDHTAAEALERELRIGHCQSAGAPVRCWCGRPWPCAVIRAADFLRDALAEVADPPCVECLRVAEAIGSVEFMDPPDGGNVPLSEQVRRMRAKLDALAVPPERPDLAKLSEREKWELCADVLNIPGRSAHPTAWDAWCHYFGSRLETPYGRRRLRDRILALASPPSAPVPKERAELVAELREAHVACTDETGDCEHHGADDSDHCSACQERMPCSGVRAADALASPQAAAEPGGQSELAKAAWGVLDAAGGIGEEVETEWQRRLVVLRAALEAQGVK